MKTTVVCGLLGSGKTTFIKNFVRGRTEKTVVLVNDFGAAGIAGEIFSAAGIVDATEFTELFDSGIHGSFFEDQITSADVVLVNKTDIAEEEKISETIRRIELINPRAIVLRSVNAEVREASLPFEAGEGPALERVDRKNKVKGAIAFRRQDDHFNFETLSCKLNRGTKLDGLSDFFHDLAAGRYGNVVRAKALIQSDEGPYRFDVVFEKVDAARFDKDVAESRVVVIGEALDKAAIENALLGRMP